MNESVEKRKKIALSKEEIGVMQWLYVKIIPPMALIIIISSLVLFFGLRFLMNKTSFGNYGLAPSRVLSDVSQFISTYMVIAVVNIVLMVLLSTIVMYIVIHNLVLPIMRITREMKQARDTNTHKTIIVRKTDKLLIPLVELINKLM